MSPISPNKGILFNLFYVYYFYREIPICRTQKMEDPDHTPPFAASYLGLHYYLSKSYSWVARHYLVNMDEPVYSKLAMANIPCHCLPAYPKIAKGRL